ncbi:MAG: hypothetical protein CMJ98_05005 [Planctomycetes bacterium]|nr:hypothetical protein [Planctomycetota bacterium]
MPSDPHPLLFPYGDWVRTQSHGSAYSLAQSGMPLPECGWLSLHAEQICGYPTAEVLPALERRVGELFGVAPERVLTTLGAHGAMDLCARHWLRAGQLAAVETPAYQALPALLRRSGTRSFGLQRTLDSGWIPDPQALADQARRSRHPLHLFLTNPHNPSGAVLAPETLEALAAAIEPTGGVLVCNEVYMEFAQPEQRVHAATFIPRAVSISGLTKAYGLGSLRSGWILLGEGLTDQRIHLQDQALLSYGDPPTATLNASLAALERLPELLAPVRRVESESRPHFLAWLRDSPSVLSTIPPFGITAFPRIERVQDTLGLQTLLAEEFDVDVVAGEHFGAPGHLRVGCAVPEATMVEGLKRLENGIRAWHERER